MKKLGHFKRTANENDQDIIADPISVEKIASFAKNIEYCIGTVKIPVGIAGPLRVNGLFAQDDYYIPLATTEAALVASYNRGSKLISKAGGCSTLILNEGVTRSPGFVFQNLIEVSQFVLWTKKQFKQFKHIAEQTTQFGKLIDTRTTVEGNHVYINFDYTTADAAGQNMVTIATAAILNYISDTSPIKPQHQFIEANLSGDKKHQHYRIYQLEEKSDC